MGMGGAVSDSRNADKPDRRNADNAEAQQNYAEPPAGMGDGFATAAGI